MEYLLGKTKWAIPEGYIPSKSNGPKPAMESHDSACILNTSDKEAKVEIFVYYVDRDPIGPYKITVPPKRTIHVRYNELKDPEVIPRDMEYASVLISDVPIVVQYTRLDSRQSENALLSTIAYS